MEVDDVRSLGHELEHDIQRLLEGFRSRTGVVPFLDVEWPYYQSMDSKSRVFAPPTVTVSLKL